jgi:hypothetical protein
MTYRVEYNGEDLEAATLDAALENAKHAIAADVGPISGWNVEHDETINDWFVQGVRAGEPIGPTAVVTGPEPVTPAVVASVAPGGPGRHLPAVGESGALRRVSFTGLTPAEVFGMATTWLAGQPDVVEICDVAWASGVDAYRLRIYYA